MHTPGPWKVNGKQSIRGPNGDARNMPAMSMAEQAIKQATTFHVEPKTTV